MSKEFKDADKPNEGQKLRDKSWVYRAFQIPESAIGPDGKILSKPPEIHNPKHTQIIKKSIENASPEIGEHVRHFRAPIEKIASLMFGPGSGIVRLVEGIQERDGEILRQAALNNWFIQPETPLIFMSRLLDCLNNNQKIEELFFDMLKPLIPKISERLEKDFPTRAAHIKEAFKLHAEQRYLSSIPLILATCEGIAGEKSGKSIFNTGA